MKQKFRVHQWERDASNPVLAPGGEWFDVTCCMNPYIVREGDTYHLFYAGGDDTRRRRICVATAAVSDPTKWTKHGVVLDLGEEGAFDDTWCVLPCVKKFGDKWHLYYTGRNTKLAPDLQGFTGIGLAVSESLRDWKRVSDSPVLRGDGFPQWPDNKGIAGGGRIIDIPQADGRILYRMHYTLATGSKSTDLFVDQAKYSVTVDSYDGVTWFNKQLALGPRKDADYENVATIALNPWRTPNGWRALYAGIGTRFGAYSICEATSEDGLVWERGEPGENLSLLPQGDGWESKMTEYPHVMDEGAQLRMFYCGNGYGSTGIGTAVAKAIDI